MSACLGSDLRVGITWPISCDLILGRHILRILLDAELVWLQLDFSVID